MKKRNLYMAKIVLIIMTMVIIATVSVACNSASETGTKENIKETVIKVSETPVITDSDNDRDDDEIKTDGVLETVLPVETVIPTVVPTDTPTATAEIPEESAAETYVATPAATPSSTATALPTVTPVPTPITSAEKEEISKDIAESFFHGEWESESGMLYIFDSQSGSLTLKEKKTGEVLLNGTYESTTDDYSEYELTMTFNGESDTYIAWKYSDTGAVRLIIEETGATYDLLWRNNE